MKVDLEAEIHLSLSSPIEASISYPEMERRMNAKQVSDSDKKKRTEKVPATRLVRGIQTANITRGHPILINHGFRG